MTYARKLTALMLASTLVASLLAPATVLAQAGCDWYVKISLKQQSENVTRKCGFTGVEWSAKLQDHKTYCVSVPPAVWKKLALERKIKLASCK